MQSSRQITVGSFSLLAAAIVIALGLTKLEFAPGRTSVIIYPAALLALLGAGLIVRAWWNQHSET